MPIDTHARFAETKKSNPLALVSFLLAHSFGMSTKLNANAVGVA